MNHIRHLTFLASLVKRPLFLLGFQKGCQTQMFRSAESEVQVISTTISSTQTELQEQATEQLIQQNQDEPEPPGLKDFLQQVEDMVVRELVKNVRSHAFDGFQASWEDHSQRVSRTLVCMSERVCQLLQKESRMVILLPDGLYHEVKVKHCTKKLLSAVPLFTRHQHSRSLF